MSIGSTSAFHRPLSCRTGASIDLTYEAVYCCSPVRHVVNTSSPSAALCFGRISSAHPYFSCNASRHAKVSDDKQLTGTCDCIKRTSGDVELACRYQYYIYKRFKQPLLLPPALEGRSSYDLLFGSQCCCPFHFQLGGYHPIATTLVRYDFRLNNNLHATRSNIVHTSTH